MQSAAFIQWCLTHLNYWTVMLLMTIESSFIPFPSEIVVPPAAYHGAATGEMTLPLIILFATAGSLLGALINYGLSVWLGRPIIYRFADSRVGHMLLLSREKIQKAETYFNEHGAVSTFVGRLITVIRQLISIPAGLARMNLGKFVLYTSLGAGIWNVFLAFLGWYLQRIIPEDQLLDTVTRYSHEVGYTLLGIVVAVITILVIRSLRKKKKAQMD